MDLELATLGDIVEELKRRNALFVFLAMSPSNRRLHEVNYAYHSNTRDEVLWMVEEMNQLLAETPDDNRES